MDLRMENVQMQRSQLQWQVTRSKTNLQHIMEEWAANEQIVAKRNRLRNFHVRATQTEEVQNDTVLPLA